MINNKRILKTGALAAAMTIVFAIFALRAAEWTKGLDSEFLVYGAATGSTGGTTGTGGSSGVASTKVLPQIVAASYDNATHYGTTRDIGKHDTSALRARGNL